ncbi:PIG-L deacetylase family protein [Persicirhabdus sediminis]|uniref:PIG-L family deacetylase n=1 Tax=Persicirhabdus sediminis TaxID=454144 RepID=A0A8J7MGC5_9BACT|nr:PIG-L family deacetylase [Persicirhabdus sediminis]MBK1792395.1 PIG-L family deacetylase [Persicirhabdus sediminis]
MDIYIPDSLDRDQALARTTHLGIGAHQDDLEFMAMDGILKCFQKKDQWFAGITCTNGAGSARSGAYAEFTDEEMVLCRQQEQRTAADIGQYAYMSQLMLPSSAVKSNNDEFVSSLAKLIEDSQAEVIYTHNPADKHATHIGVFAGVLKAIRSLPADKRPKQLIGCEVWRNLDWLDDDKKVVMDLTAHQNLAAALNGVFDSQISGGKRYDLAVQGRRAANATFFDSHSTDDAESIAFGIDLSALISDESIDPKTYIASLINDFKNDVDDALSNFF